MARRQKVDTRFRLGIDKKDPYEIVWALLELSRKELHTEGKFVTLSPTDIKNLLQALMDRHEPSGKSEDVASLIEIQQYMKK